jgi:hypothetical protein
MEVAKYQAVVNLYQQAYASGEGGGEAVNLLFSNLDQDQNAREIAMNSLPALAQQAVEE